MPAILKEQRFWIVTAALLCAAYVWLPLLASGDRSSPIREEDVPLVDYLCKETQQHYQLKAQSLPVTNPETGRDTLWPALYCRECRTWKIVPEIPLAGVMPSCPQHQIPLKRSSRS